MEANRSRDPLTNRLALWRVEQVIWIAESIASLILVVEFFLRLFGASASSGFAQLVFDASHVLLAPFAGTFGAWSIDRFSVDLDCLLALAVYSVVASAAIVVLRILGSRSPAVD